MAGLFGDRPDERATAAFPFPAGGAAAPGSPAATDRTAPFAGGPSAPGFGAPNGAPWDGPQPGDRSAVGAASRSTALLLVAALAVGIAALVVVLSGSDVLVSFLAWFAAGPVTIGLLAAYSVQDTRERARLFHSPRPYGQVLYGVVVVVAAVGIALSAWEIADWAGRL